MSAFIHHLFLSWLVAVVFDLAELEGLVQMSFSRVLGLTFGLIYLTVINLTDLKINLKRVTILIVSLLLSIWCFTSTILPTAIYYPAIAIIRAEKHQEIREALDMIPSDATVSATTFFTTYLSNREVIYDVEYCTKEHLF